MIREDSKGDCFSSLSCGEEEYHVCERREQCLTAAENLERMTATNGIAGVPFRVFLAWRKERWGLSCMALREMGAAHV